MKSFLRICCVLLSVLLFSCEKDTMPTSDTPNIITGQSANVYRKGATLYGNIKNPDASPVESFGIELASFSRPGMTIEQYFATAQSFEVDQMDAQGNFSVQVGGLEPGRMYLYRSFVNSGHNVVYGVDSTFQTPHNTAPVFGDMDTSEVSYTAFDISVNLLDDGGDSLQVMGFIYREAAEELAQEIVIGPEIKSVYYPSNQLADQQFTLSIKDLHAGRRYAVRAFAMADGIGYSKMMYVKTRTSDATLVSACDTSNASYNSLHLKASILAENNQYPVTEVGFCYSSESSEPTVAHLTLPATLTGTDFEATLTQLISEKTYYIRPYARQSDNAYIYGEVLEYQVPYYESYVVEFDANGGEGTMEPQIFFAGASQSLNVNAFVYTGYAFMGWKSSLDGNVITYFDQQEITLSEDITLYAQWCEAENGYAYVDLGLPSGIKWATCNVGATTPVGYGDYFAWGETDPKYNYDWSTYKYCNGSENTLTKYCTNGNYGYEGFSDGKTTLELMDDAARVNWGGKWRMPDLTDINELKNLCTWMLTKLNGVNGYIVTSEINGNSIFLPVAGSKYNNEFSSSSSYWSRSCASFSYNGTEHPVCLWFNLNSNYVGCADTPYRDSGYSVRAVFSDTEQSSFFYTLSFNANGGTGTMSEQFFMPGVSRTLNANLFTRSGYEFVGWNTVADGSGTDYFDRQELALIQNLTLYAQWQKISGTLNGHDYMDMGLPSGTLWATCNIGATTPEEYGDYFAWGETEPKDNYDWSTYKYCNGTSNTLKKYCTDSNYGYEGFSDGKTTLELMDDAAYVNWGGKWRMPTKIELEELKDKCTWMRITLKGVDGYKVTSKVNGNSIFLPEAKSRTGNHQYEVCGEYSSNMLYSRNSHRAYCLGFYSYGIFVGERERYDGHTVRAVISGEEQPSPFYILSFEANLGTGKMKSQIFMPGESQTIALNTFTRPGCEFVGWNTVANGGGTTYTDLQEISLDADLTLYAQWKGKQVISGTETGYTYVDLGLPSGTKWATCNVGSTTPEGYGDYFAWGEIEPRDKNDRYDDNTYKYSNGSSRTLTKYCTDSNYGYEGFYDGKTTLELMDDAAHMNWGGKWRMPTDEELDELKYNCIWSKTTQNGVNGYLVTSNINGQCMFLPDMDGYWTSSLGHYPDDATFLKLDNLNAHYTGYRAYGKSVRAVFSDTEQPSPLFTLSFDANGGTGTMRSQFFMPSVSRVLAANNFFRWGYIFIGWNTSANGSGTAYSEQEEIILTQDLTLYAQWKEQVVSGTNNGHDYVDLGLPSGQKWATCNIGATTPEEYGDYFAWGETEPKDNYDWSTYKYCNGTKNTLTKYCTDSNYGFLDGRTSLELMDDAAHVNWGGDWRIPADKDLVELKDNCVWSFLVLNGVNGFMVTSKTNGNSIFLPMAGWRSSTSDHVGTCGFYLSNTIHWSMSICANYLVFTLKSLDWWFNLRSNGYTVRAVCP